MSEVVVEGAVDGAVAGSNDVAAVTGLRQQQVAVSAVALVGEAVGPNRLDQHQGAVRQSPHQAVGSHKTAVIMWRTAATRDHRHKQHQHHQYDNRQPFHRYKDSNLVLSL